MKLGIALLLGLAAAGRPARAAGDGPSRPASDRELMLFGFEEDAEEDALAAAGAPLTVMGNSTAVRAWCAERGGTCCAGIDSCLFAGEATMSFNACNGDRACGSDFTTPLGVIGPKSCNAADSCAGTVPEVRINSCNGVRSCAGASGVIGPKACNGEDACANSQAEIKTNSCNDLRACAGASGVIGPKACNGEDGCADFEGTALVNSCNGVDGCNGASGVIGPKACNGEGGCADFEGTALVNSCNGVDGCNGVGPSGTINSKACNGPRGCDGADTVIGRNSCGGESACSNVVNVNTPIPKNECNSGVNDCDTVGFVQLPDTRPPVCLDVTTDIFSFQGQASDNRPPEDGETDNGIWTVALLGGSENLVLNVDPSFLVGDGTVSFSALRLDDVLPSSGTVEVTDRAGNACTLPIELEPLDQTPPVCTELAGEDLVDDFNGGAEDADTGIASVTLAAGASNLGLTVPSFDAGNRTITFAAARLNDTLPATGTVVVKDRVGLNCTLEVALDPFDADVFAEETGFPTSLHEDLFGVPSALAVPIYTTQDVLPEAAGIYPAVNEDGTSFFVQVASITIPSTDLDSEIPDDASQELLDLIAANTFSTFSFRGFLIFETKTVEVEALAYTLADAEPAGTSNVLVFDDPLRFPGLDDDALDTDFDFPPTFPPSPPERRLGDEHDGAYGVVPYEPRGRELQEESCGNALQEAIEKLNCQAPEQTYVNQPCVSTARFAYNQAIKVARGDYNTAIAIAKGILEAAKIAIAIQKAKALRLELLACVLVGFLATPATGALCAARAIALVILKTNALRIAANLAWELAKRNAEEALRLALAAACQAFRLALFACVRCVACGDPDLTPCGDVCYDPATQKCCPEEAIVGKDSCCPDEKSCPDGSCIPQDSCCPEDKPCNGGCIPKKDCCESPSSRALRGFKEDVLSGRRLAEDPCCDDPEDPCCGSDDPCCGSEDPCCGSKDPCCGSNDPCCGSSGDCCGQSGCGGSSGDPHMTTFDGFRYDCQGRGEFVLVAAGETVVQARFKKRGRVAVTSGVATTQGPGSTKVEVSVPVDGSSPVLVVNGAVINPSSRGYEDSSVIVSSTSGSDAGPFRITYKASNLSVLARYSTGFSGYLNLNVGLPQALRDAGTVGLLGSADNDPTNDWMTPNGTVLEIPASRSDRIGLPSLEYCLDNWCVDDANSTLFTYYEEDFTFFSGCNDLDRDVVDIEAAPPAAKAFCGVDEACLVDFIEGGQDVAKETLVATADLDAIFTTGSLVANPASLTAGTSVNVKLSIDTSGSGLAIDEFVLFRVDSVTGEQQGEGPALTLTDGNNNGVFDGSINIFSSEAGEAFGFRAIPVIAGEQDPGSPAAILRLVTVRSYADETGIVDEDDDPGCPGPCDDGNPCTIDFCLNSVCRTDPVACEIGKRCDPFSGRCQDVENLVPCIAVIDEWNNRAYNSEWATFRERYPQRPFCLLVPNGSLQTLPIGFADDTVNNPDGLDRTIASTVSRDNGNVAALSDWQTICELGSLTAENVQFVGLFVDDSGSMRVATVQASLGKFEADMAAKGIEIRRVVNAVERWVDPFLTDLVPV